MPTIVERGVGVETETHIDVDGSTFETTRVKSRVKMVAGLPDRWGIRAYEELTRALRKHGPASREYQSLAALLDEITNAPIPVDATDAQLCVMAARYASDCASVPVVESVEEWPLPNVPGDGVGPRQYAKRGQAKGARARMAEICKVRGIEPAGGEDEEAMRRMSDPAWWRRNLRRVHGRLFEHAAMRLGFVSIRAGSYCSDETVKRRVQQISRNLAALKAATLRNEKGEEFTLYDLMSKGMGNKANRKGELMLRMAGCEEVARELGHVGLFITQTCPSKYHPVLAKTGQTNPKYLGATPREAQAYLNGVWARQRAQFAREGIAPYGFRIAEPHHDGCPHWHMLVFVPKSQAGALARIMGDYAMAEDAYELDCDAARNARLKIVEIDPAKGSAAGYIAKYVGKNIDDSQGAAFDEEGAVDLTGERITTPCERVDAWASVWGIRQFQGLGMPPVTVWRELRRVKEEHEQAPDYIRAALLASRRIEGCGPGLDGKPLVLHAASFAEYIRAQGGINLGRGYRIAVATEEREVAGRYGMIDAEVPLGVLAKAEPEVLYLSKRYTWTRTGRAPRAGVPWSPLNNCTQPEADPFWWSGGGVDLADFDDSDWFDGAEFGTYWIPPEDVAAIELAAERRKPVDVMNLSEAARAAFAAQAAYAEARAH